MSGSPSLRDFLEVVFASSDSCDAPNSSRIVQIVVAQPLMYSEIAAWWPLLSPPEDYEEEAAFYTRTFLDAAPARIESVLELGSGGGNNASFMKKHFTMTLVDASVEMLAISRRLNPECDHLQGDMRTIRLEQQFDGVFIHDAINYMTTREDLRAAIATASMHTRPGGVALFCPDYTRETFKPSTDHGGHDDGRRGMRYVEWTWDPDPADATFVTDYAYLLREENGDVRVLHDRHIEGLFSRSEWSDLLSEVGFAPSTIPFVHPDAPQGAEIFRGVKRI